MARIGIAGLGRMGAAMAERLLDQGHSLVVWNRTAEKAQPLAARGTTLAASPAALAQEAEVILTILSDAAAIEQVYGGAEGILAADLTGKLVLEMSTVRPETQVALAGRVRARGGAHVECPVGGTTGPARQGKLLGLAAGEAADVARARPILDDLCRRVEHVGPVGAGASMKLAINLPLLVYYQALGEALTLCRHLGHDPAWLIELLADTSGAPTMLKTRGPSIALALAGGDPKPPTFDVDLIRKDLRTMLEEARSRGTDLPVVARALEVYDGASAAGWGDRDAATLPSYWPGRSGG
jgi:3-hydroxyisobutyrate dehydrogenase